MYNYDEDVFQPTFKVAHEKTLGDDFDGWWKLKKYSGDIEAKKYSDVEIKARNGSNAGWPGNVNVTYWVELYNGMAVGYSELEKGKATFPIAVMS